MLQAAMQAETVDAVLVHVAKAVGATQGHGALDHISEALPAPTAHARLVLRAADDARLELRRRELADADIPSALNIGVEGLALVVGTRLGAVTGAPRSVG